MDAARETSRHRKHKYKPTLGVTVMVMAWMGGSTYFEGPAEAMHEVDHRFSVEGYVCGTDGRPVPETKVIVKDTRVSIGTAVFTDARGYYKATLHLHNDNRGDPIVVAALEQEQQVTAQFDPADIKTERQATVNIGSGCETQSEEPRRWLYYGAGVGLAVMAAVTGARFVRKQRQGRKRGKGQRK